MQQSLSRASYQTIGFAIFLAGLQTTSCHSNRAPNSGGAELDATRCSADEVCVTVAANQTTGSVISFILYEVGSASWPADFHSIPVPDWVLLETKSIPDSFPFAYRVNLHETLHAISGGPIEGATLGLAAFTGNPAARIVYPTDARGFSDQTVRYIPGQALDFGRVVLDVPGGGMCDLNPMNADCTTGGLFWELSTLGEASAVPGAIYMDAGDLDGDGVQDIAMVGWPQVENPDAPPSDYKLALYYLRADLSLREMVIIDQYTEEDPTFFSPRGVKILTTATGEPLIVVGTSLPGRISTQSRATVLAYTEQGGMWERQTLLTNDDPATIAYHSALVVPCDIDGDGDEDLALGGSGEASTVGNWLERGGSSDTGWTPHLRLAVGERFANIRKTMAYGCADMDNDGDNDIVYNAYFNIPDPDRLRVRGEIWLGLNPGSGNSADGAWEIVVVDPDNRNSADMFLFDFNDDGHTDVVANQIYDGTISIYPSPGGDLSDEWPQHIVATRITSPSDMWLADMNRDGHVDIVTADNTGHAGIWHEHPGRHADVFGAWKVRRIFSDVGLPGDFLMGDMDSDGDLDWVGTSMTLGVPFIVRQTHPTSSLVGTITLPEENDLVPTRLLVALYAQLPPAGPPDAIVAMVNNIDSDNDGILDVEQLLARGPTMTVAVPELGVRGSFYALAVLYVEGGGEFAPVSGVDFVGSTGPFEVGAGQANIAIVLER